jgi:hypothetical protein
MVTGEVAAELVGDEIIWYKNIGSEFERGIFDQVRRDIMHDEHLALYGVKPKCKLPPPLDFEEWINSGRRPSSGRTAVQYDF